MIFYIHWFKSLRNILWDDFMIFQWLSVLFSHAIITRKSFQWFFNDFKDPLILHGFFIHWHPLIYCHFQSCNYHSEIIPMILQWFSRSLDFTLIFIHWHPLIFYILNCFKCCFSDISVVLLKISPVFREIGKQKMDIIFSENRGLPPVSALLSALIILAFSEPIFPFRHCVCLFRHRHQILHCSIGITM